MGCVGMVANTARDCYGKRLEGLWREPGPPHPYPLARYKKAEAMMDITT